MEGNNTCENHLGAEFFPKQSDSVAHTTLTQVQLNNPINIQQNIKTIFNVDRVEQYCRICGSENNPNNLVDIFGDQGIQLALHSNIVNHLHLQVEKDDLLPHQVCTTCVCQLNICHQLFEVSHATDTKLRQLLLLSQIQENSSICLSVPVEMITSLGGFQNNEENSANNQKKDLPSSDDKILLNSHELQFSESSLEQCDMSDKKDHTPNEMKDQVKVNKKCEKPASLLCHVCGKHFKSPSNLQSHKRTHLADALKKKHHCTLCPKSFRSKFFLSEHMNAHEGLTPYKCNICDKEFHSRIQLRQHAQTHVQESRRAACEVCGARFSRRSNLRAHARTHARHRTFPCRLCLQPFPTFSAMLCHRRQHTQEDLQKRLSLDKPPLNSKGKILPCEVCGKLMTNRDSLVAHLEQHRAGTVSARYECADCGKVLSSRQSLTYHRRSQHSGERRYHCSVCSLGFMTERLLRAHETRHTGEKPFKCETCWKGFKSKNNLNQHMQKHNGVKNFECLDCGKSFSRKGALTVHNRKHTGERPFVCDLCGRPFTQKNDMLKHQRTHSEPNARTRTCDVCANVFSSKSALVKHKEAVHTEETDIVPLIITNNVFGTQIITEDGQNIVFATVQALDHSLVTPSTSIS